MGGRIVTLGPAQFSAFADGVYADRLQVPLKLGWALTVHKSQGMSLTKLEVHVRDAFDYGMVYVALSRAVTSEGLRVVGFDPSRIKAHPSVLKFYRDLQEAENGQGPQDG